MIDRKREIEVLKLLFNRYKEKILMNEEYFSKIKLPDRCDKKSLLNLINEAIDNTEKYPSDKMHRWLGFTQGVLSVIGLIDVDEEREFSRVYLHSYHNIKPDSFG